MSKDLWNAYKEIFDPIAETFNAIVDESYDEYSVARFYGQSPQIDTIIYINEKLNIGDFYKVKIINILEYDLEGEII